MDYEKAYKDALAKAREIHRNEDGKRFDMEWLFPELKESENEQSKKWILEYLYDGLRKSDEKFKSQFKTAIAWLEKQCKQKLCMIQWKGDNLKEVINFTGKDKSFDKWFTSFEEYEKYVREHNDIFKLFNEDDSHYEVPVGAWIIKTPDGYNVASKAVFKQKPIDKAEPKFKVGVWITNSIETVQITGYDIDYGYQVDYKGNLQHRDTDIIEKEYHLWTIQDAKDGDVLTNGELILIFKRFEEPAYREHIVAYVGLDISGNIQVTDGYWQLGIDKAIPATKEQRELLFKKMKEAGYEWNAEKKELKLLITIMVVILNRSKSGVKRMNHVSIMLLLRVEVFMENIQKLLIGLNH